MTEKNLLMITDKDMSGVSTKSIISFFAISLLISSKTKQKNADVHKQNM